MPGQAHRMCAQPHASGQRKHTHAWVRTPGAGARVDFKTHLDDGDWTGPNGEQGIGAAAAVGLA